MNRKFLAGPCLVAVTWLTFSVCLAENTGEKTSPAIGVEKIYEHKHGYKLNAETNSYLATAVFDHEGALVYFAFGTHLQAIDSRSNQVAGRASLEAFPCEWEFFRRIWRMASVPNHAALLAAYCDSLYLLHTPNLVLGKKAVDLSRMGGQSFIVSPDGRFLAVFAAPGVVLMETTDYEQVAKWPYPGEEGGDKVLPEALAFSKDGALLATLYNVMGQRSGSRIEVHEVPSGEIVSAWFIDRKEGSIEDLRFFPGRPDLLVTRVSLSFHPTLLDFWDLNTGRRVHRAEHDHTDHWIGSHKFFAPDGTWVIGSRIDDPQDTPFLQEFIICDPWTGELLYASRKRKWTFFDHLAFTFGRSGFWGPLAVHEIADVSSDGKYLLVIKHNRIELYQVIGNPRVDSAVNEP